MRKNLNNLKAGEKVTLLFKGDDVGEDATFLGFTGNEEQYSETVKFNTLKEVKEHYLVKTLKKLEDYNRDNQHLKDNGYGFSVYAMFVQYDSNNKLYKWGAYLFEGKWVYGSSADALRFA